ncbi:hypothetical protein D3C80_1176170 [compost metagenome]
MRRKPSICSTTSCITVSALGRWCMKCCWQQIAAYGYASCSMTLPATARKKSSLPWRCTRTSISASSTLCIWGAAPWSLEPWAACLIFPNNTDACTTNCGWPTTAQPSSADATWGMNISTPGPTSTSPTWTCWASARSPSNWGTASISTGTAP